MKLGTTGGLQSEDAMRNLLDGGGGRRVCRDGHSLNATSDMTTASTAQDGRYDAVGRESSCPSTMAYPWNRACKYNHIVRDAGQSYPRCRHAVL